MRDHEPKASYFKFCPADPTESGGHFSTPLTGEVDAGRIYEFTNPTTVEVLHDHPEWEEVKAKDFEAQTQADEKE